ncbi:MULTISPECIES: hypothetical protein [unclassified Streptomyces]|uniref:hypothetical protein n=1 Tax=unclassified Streptomyces TaxID=2593676 RepID=UPI00081E8279|nr:MULTISPECIES: hypothetical protein [unclassified Streptomyces]MYZ37511.1 hypothetical protein [Streptomyces sp. SID4917]SCF91873.1 hypothetical protein GA0115259_1048217 [Streptomyces sp. MnatMP-M17]
MDEVLRIASAAALTWGLGCMVFVAIVDDHHPIAFLHDRLAPAAARVVLFFRPTGGHRAR